MDDGELDFSNQEVLSNSIMGEIGCDCSMDSLFDEIMKDMHACTHTHTCNPPGPDNEHTHTCLHVHTKIVPASTEEKTTTTDDSAESEDKKSKRRPLGNREAVRKYREKKKARAASLEEEVVRLRAVNQQLVKRLQGQAALEAEVARLRCLLVDIRGRIDGEIGCFPYQKLVNPNVNSGYVMNQCNVQCDDQLYCPYPGGVGKSSMVNRSDEHGFTGCGLEDNQCLSTPTIEPTDLPACDAGNGATKVISSGASKRKRGGRAANAGRS
uniref:BZIP domain-containing protein n=1 Tax=Kalanchoe fedtschenkoi TaxID=63787 RepID=A0A7N0U526_KALFE